jgi:F-type H+-transporting ATPase subunit delta
MTTTSREYAEALFELAAQDNLITETLDGVVTVVSALRQTPAYRDLLASPAIPKEERVEALNAAFRGKIPEILRAILRMMVTRGHISAVEGMARDYEELARDYRGEAEARVTSAVPLRESEMVILRQKLEKKLARQVILRCETDPSLIGGIRVEVDGRVIDGSLRNKLDEIKEVMNA